MYAPEQTLATRRACAPQARDEFHDARLLRRGARALTAGNEQRVDGGGPAEGRGIHA